MVYRTVRPADNGYPNEAAQTFAQHDQIQETMYTSGPDELLDTLLVIANVCEQRALVFRSHPAIGDWYDLTGALLRSLLEMTTYRDGPKADVSLEDPTLYFPDTNILN